MTDTPTTNGPAAAKTRKIDPTYSVYRAVKRDVDDHLADPGSGTRYELIASDVKAASRKDAIVKSTDQEGVFLVIPSQHIRRIERVKKQTVEDLFA